MWSVVTGGCVRVFTGHNEYISSLTCAPNGKILASGDTGGNIIISALAWHPNGTYLFTASDETDKSIRMWSVVTGGCVRVFTGHNEYISSLTCAPNGKILASGDTGGNIMFWDIEKGTRIKRSRGHAKGGIWSMDFSVESNVLVSGGQDGTVRLWDVELPADGHKAVPQQGTAPTQEGGEGAPATGGAVERGTTGGQGSSGTGTGGTGGGKKKGKEVIWSMDFSVESNVLVSGGQDGTVRLWDVELPADGHKAVPQQGTAPTQEGGEGAPATGGAVERGATGGQGSSGTGTGGTGGGKKKGKEVMITPDQISAFPTKKTPVMAVQFTRMNLVVAGGCFDPER
ncbi:hypothetical protein BN1723_015929 [Verticillium longisporum]|uniref:Anaphase-promoting complex subunit 4 WD40 domain-containing protein n=1 Tax=Verticillium longisporum TaxID=100787 RepID=A0A0G4N5F1_VERLO|nr:hypothetical protein BN1723_015929 [Verticillium longisporum]